MPALLFIYVEVKSLNKKSNLNNIVSTIWNLAEPIANNLGLNIWDIKFLKEGANYYLRIFIDSENGITLDDCENMSRAINKPLDDLDPISQNYCLEVCSPGINRKLTRDEHLKKSIGQKVNVRLIRPLDDGTKQINAVLVSFNKDELGLFYDSKSENFNIFRKNIAFIKLDDFKN